MTPTATDNDNNNGDDNNNNNNDDDDDSSEEPPPVLDEDPRDWDPAGCACEANPAPRSGRLNLALFLLFGLLLRRRSKDSEGGALYNGTPAPADELLPLT